MSKLDEVLKTATLRELHPYSSPEVKQEIKEVLLAEMQAVYDEQAKKSLYETTLTRHHYIKALKKRIENL